jgi:hypothetical protein
MENENKDKTILTDDQLKEVAGGSGLSIVICSSKKNPEDCMKNRKCIWLDDKCVQESSKKFN